MLHLHLFPFLLLTTAQMFFAVLADVEDQVPAVQNSSSLYHKLCENSATSIGSETFTLKTMEEAPKWYHIMGNDAARQYFGSLLKGAQLSKNDANDYEGMCFEVNKPFAQLGKVEISSHNGFGKRDRTFFNCVPNGDLQGSLTCLVYNIETKIHATDIYQVVNTDAANVNIIVGCFANNEVGWKTLSQSPTLTKAENAAVTKQIAALGFDSKNIVQMYDETCKNI